MVNAVKLPVNTDIDAMDMANAMFGDGIVIVKAEYFGDEDSAGLYSKADTLAPGVAPSDSGVILSTGKASDFTNSSGSRNQTADKGTNTDDGINNDSGLNQIAGVRTYDAAIFEATFVPEGSVLTMQITFSSEEYLEYVNTGFNDAVGVWVNGVPAVLTVGDGEISINNINPGSNSNLYVDNPNLGANDLYNTEMDGFTVTLTLKAPVIAGQENTIRIGIADGGDSAYDSNLLIAGNSIQTAVVATDDAFEIEGLETKTIDLLGNDFNASGGTLTITQINGQAVVAGSVVTLDSGLQITVNADGTITLLADAVADGVKDNEIETFTYEVTNEDGITDVGFVTATLIPCFAAGTRIETARGMVAIERIRVGDLVRTLDDGFQPVRWCGGRMVRSAGALAAVIIPAGTFGAHGALRVSPQHRLHIAGWRTQLHFAEAEVLLKAIHLVRSGVLRQDTSGAPIGYHHLIFDRHQIICAEGLWSESYLPGPQTLPGHDAATQAEILALFPALQNDPARGYGPPARAEAPGALAGLLV